VRVSGFWSWCHRHAEWVLTVRTFATDDAQADLLDDIGRLLVAAFGDRFSADDWEHTLGGRHVVVVEDGVLLAHAAVVEREIEVAGRSLRVGYVEGVAADPARQLEGHGTLAMTEVTGVLVDGFEMGALSTSRHTFYSRLGWVRWCGATFVRRDTERLRTVDEDDGIMVLRFGPSAHIDLTADITCRARSGDDW